MSRADEIIASGDARAILRMALGAMVAAGEGRYCQCDDPALTGRDLMCGNCLLENLGQREARERAMREPHQFEPNPRKDSAAARLDMCRLCAGWREDPRHLPAPPAAQEGER